MNRRYKLESWNYAQLRDTINTSSDIELLEACREEFHRRLKVYHQWKFRNSFKGIRPTAGEKQSKARNGATTNAAVSSTSKAHLRAPESVMNSFYAENENGFRNPFIADDGNVDVRGKNEQRFFRLSFLQNGANSKGMWYAHFNGKWIARQMEIHSEREPILLVAGKNNMAKHWFRPTILIVV